MALAYKRWQISEIFDHHHLDNQHHHHLDNQHQHHHHDNQHQHHHHDLRGLILGQLAWWGQGRLSVTLVRPLSHLDPGWGREGGHESWGGREHKKVGGEKVHKEVQNFLPFIEACTLPSEKVEKLGNLSWDSKTTIYFCNCDSICFTFVGDSSVEVGSWLLKYIPISSTFISDS